MDYNRFLKAEDIPTIRRLDYIVKDTDRFQAGKLYAALRKLVILNDYNSHYKSEEIRKAEFEKSKFVVVPKLEWVNQWMQAHGKENIFTDLEDHRKIGKDYNYFWNLRTEKRFIKEEAEARLGISGRKPVPAIYLEKYEAQICEMMETLKSEL
ncbi:MAG: hypothetical protein IIW48_11110 [Clostridia bacterium]|nr:hypothetical protein [Clostridia bacterium]